MWISSAKVIQNLLLCICNFFIFFAVNELCLSIVEENLTLGEMIVGRTLPYPSEEVRSP